MDGGEMCEKDISHAEVFTGASPPPSWTGKCVRPAAWLSHQGPGASLVLPPSLPSFSQFDLNPVYFENH